MQEPRRLAGTVKLAYGLGMSAEGIKSGAFNAFLLFFYQQIVGLDPALCGVALFIALCVDALLDPIIGAWSDGLRSVIGRRHPFMYASILPMAVCFLLVFRPPAGMSEMGKFLWLAAFAIGTRVSMAVFVIPHLSLVPELTQESGERASLTSLRTVFAWIFGLLNTLLGYTVFLKSTPGYPQGLLNPAGYPPFALFGAVTMLVAMLLSALGTQKAAQRAQLTRGETRHATLRELPAAMRQAFAAPAYRAVVLGGLFLSVAFGMTENLSNYMNTFFWGFSSAQVGMFVVVIFLASLCVLAIARPLLARFGSRNVAVACALVVSSLGPLLIGLRLTGFTPPRGDSRLLFLLGGGAFFIYGAVILGTVVVGKMIADVSDAHEHTTGARQEGLLFSAGMFLNKAASGLGTLVSGIIIKAAHFPEGASYESVAPQAVNQLGMGAALGTLLLGVCTTYFFSRFDLSRERHENIVSELLVRRAENLRSSAQSGPST